jgi:hypothetical protein
VGTRAGRDEIFRPVFSPTYQCQLLCHPSGSHLHFPLTQRLQLIVVVAHHIVRHKFYLAKPKLDITIGQKPIVLTLFTRTLYNMTATCKSYIKEILCEAGYYLIECATLSLNHYTSHFLQGHFITCTCMMK